MKLIVGLGNPGTKYAKTRHNAGFLAIEYLAEKWQACQDFEYIGDKQYAHAFVHEFTWHGGKEGRETLCLIMPQTYMNHSGEALHHILKYTKDIDLTRDLWVLHDELHLPLGRIKLDKGASSAGHNGVQNITDQLKTKEYIRLRIGIAPQESEGLRMEDFVLDRFTKEEQDTLQETVLPRTYDALMRGLEQGFEAAREQVNKKTA